MKTPIFNRTYCIIDRDQDNRIIRSFSKATDEFSRSLWIGKDVSEIIIKREDTNDEFFLTTVLQGDYDFGSGEIPSTINLGIEASNSVLIMFSTCDTDAINRGRCTSADENNCISWLGEPLFDFVIQ